jgi:hypothetical protein
MAPGTRHWWPPAVQDEFSLYPSATSCEDDKSPFTGLGVKLDKVWGMRHTSPAPYFYGATKKSLHKPRATFENMLFEIS